MSPWSFLFFLLGILGFVRGATTDTTCLADCSAWSVTLGYCRSIYGNLPMYQNYTFANDFLGCLCVGGRSTGPPLGNETFLAEMGVCSTCSPTPELIKRNLKDLLRLCAIQAHNGTAADIMTWMPVGYSTINNEAYAGSLAPGKSGARKRSSGSYVRMVLPVTIGVLVLSMLWSVL